MLTAVAIGLGSILTAQTTTPAGAEYKAPDGSLSLRVPPGWRATTVPMNGLPVHVLQPVDGGEDRILVAAGPVEVNSIQELALQSVQTVTQQLLPGSRATSAPKFVDGSGGPTAEMSYELPGQSVWWQTVVMLKDKRFITVLGGARRDRSAAMEQQSRAVFGSVRLLAANPAGAGPAAGAANGQLAQLILGHWTWYHRTDNGGGRLSGSTSREIWIYPNGRYQYTATTYVPNMPPDIDPTTTITGTYQLQGNRITVRADNGQTQTLTLEIIEGGKGLKIDGEVYIRD
jgi:hypothetical protein